MDGKGKQGVESWGPLYACLLSLPLWKFNWRWVLLNLFKGSNNIESHISKRMNELICTAQWSHQFCPNKAGSFYNFIVRRIPILKMGIAVDNVRLFGPTIFKLTKKSPLGKICRGQTLKCFNRCIWQRNNLYNRKCCKARQYRRVRCRLLLN